LITRLVGIESEKIQQELKLLFDPKDMMEEGHVFDCEKKDILSVLKKEKPIMNYLFNYLFGK